MTECSQCHGSKRVQIAETTDLINVGVKTKISERPCGQCFGKATHLCFIEGRNVLLTVNRIKEIHYRLKDKGGREKLKDLHNWTIQNHGNLFFSIREFRAEIKRYGFNITKENFVLMLDLEAETALDAP